MGYSRNQKVFCTYHFTRWFKPSMCGRILLKHPVRKKHLFSQIHDKNNKDGKCFWYFVKMVNGLIVLMPETCIKDLKESIEKDNEWLYHSVLDRPKEGKDKSNIEAWLSLQESQAKKMLYEIGKLK